MFGPRAEDRLKNTTRRSKGGRVRSVGAGWGRGRRGGGVDGVSGARKDRQEREYIRLYASALMTQRFE